MQAPLVSDRALMAGSGGGPSRTSGHPAVGRAAGRPLGMGDSRLPLSPGGRGGMGVVGRSLLRPRALHESGEGDSLPLSPGGRGGRSVRDGGSLPPPGATTSLLDLDYGSQWTIYRLLDPSQLATTCKYLFTSILEFSGGVHTLDVARIKNWVL